MDYVLVLLHIQQEAFKATCIRPTKNILEHKRQDKKENTPTAPQRHDTAAPVSSCSTQGTHTSHASSQTGQRGAEALAGAVFTHGQHCTAVCPLTQLDRH